MLEFHEALDIITSNTDVLGSEKIHISETLHRVLAEDVFYDVDLPPFDKSAMDGYACRKEDIDLELEPIEVIYAGKQPEKQITQGQCAKIMTGAVVPQGANCVIMREHIEELKNGKIICPSGKTKENICYKGEDIKIGDLALPKGTLITSKHLPILANAGISSPLVYKQADVSIFATGSELVEPEERPLSYQIRNSNSSQMMAQLSEMGLKGTYRGIIRDNYDETKSKINLALTESDVVIMSGGVSVGDFDFIPEVIKDLGFDILLTRSAIQPGKPIIFAKKNNKYCIGLAGNPASSYIQFKIYIQVFLYLMSGHKIAENTVKMTLDADFTRRKTARMLLLPAYNNGNGQVSLIEYHGSAHINALIHANCIIQVPIGTAALKKGDLVDVRPL